MVDTVRRLINGNRGRIAVTGNSVAENSVMFQLQHQVGPQSRDELR